MDTNKILSASTYFSILFAPFILPIIVYFLTSEKEVKYHAKRSLISHIIPTIFFVFLMLAIFANFLPLGFTGDSASMWTSMTTALIFMGLYTVINLVLLIWNIVQGVKVLRHV
ncbi:MULTISPECIES: DUF4870 domain-containing protein [Psychrobacillus]|uniref:DUF4870 domain-containing protein n=1 Tax=Psychrobacillus faecigallinarum TaxID=2762235 RepID=A0ABR8REK5_9BACI|nr:DUF4870 domain-containing protein [Psychrobacillus faecigallinarum]MBD7946223.1 DUF4870 domain-containing protein [Psychrobacillus faecigallinarum]QGM29090.1 DUF4870 domain-containing protein [Bacillus sp. N3536]